MTLSPVSRSGNAELLDRLADAIAIDDGQDGYQMQLVSLVNGVSTYHLTYQGEDVPLAFGSTAECYDHINDRKNRALVATILRTLRDHGPTEEMLASARNAPLPLVHIDSLAGRADLEIRSRFAAALTNLIEASEPQAHLQSQSRGQDHD